MNVAITAALIGLAVTLAEVIKVLISKVVSKKNGNGSGVVLSKDCGSCLRGLQESYTRIEFKVNELHRWHDSRDADGVFTWYVRRSLEDAIKQLAASQVQLSENIRHLTTIMDGLLRSQEETRREFRSLEVELDRRKRED